MSSHSNPMVTPLQGDSNGLCFYAAHNTDTHSWHTSRFVATNCKLLHPVWVINYLPQGRCRFASWSYHKSEDLHPSSAGTPLHGLCTEHKEWLKIIHTTSCNPNWPDACYPNWSHTSHNICIVWIATGRSVSEEHLTFPLQQQKPDWNICTRDAVQCNGCSTVLLYSNCTSVWAALHFLLSNTSHWFEVADSNRAQLQTGANPSGT